MTEGAFDVARRLVEDGVAPDAAVAFGARVNDRWEIRGAHAGSGVHAEEPIFDLASITKSMTAVAIARSDLAKNERLGAVVEEARGTASADATLELLLAHRAGLEAHLPLHEKLLLGGEASHATVLKIVADARRPACVGPIPEGGFPPVYSDLGYILAGEALARTSHAEDAGQAIEWLVVDALSAGGREPLELGTARSLTAQNLGFERRVRKTEVVAWRGGEVRGQVHDENAWALTGTGGSGHAGMFGTALAVAAFGSAILDALQGRGGPLAGADLGWLVVERPGGSLRAGFDGKSASGSTAGDRASPRTFGHLGFTGTSLWIDPDAEAVVVVLTNRVHPTRENQAIRVARPIAHDALFAMAAALRAA